MNKSTGVKRLAKVAKEINVGVQTVLEFLNKNGFPIDNNPNAKIDEDAYNALLEEFHLDKIEKQESMKISLSSKKEKLSAEIAEAEVENFEEKENSDAHTPVEEKPAVEEKNIEKPSIKVVSKIDLDSIQNKGKKKTTEKKEEPEVVKEEEKPKKEEKTEIPVAEEVPEILEKLKLQDQKLLELLI